MGEKCRRVNFHGSEVDCFGTLGFSVVGKIPLSWPVSGFISPLPPLLSHNPQPVASLLPLNQSLEKFYCDKTPKASGMLTSVLSRIQFGSPCLYVSVLSGDSFSSAFLLKWKLFSIVNLWIRSLLSFIEQCIKDHTVWPGDVIYPSVKKNLRHYQWSKIQMLDFPHSATMERIGV